MPTFSVKLDELKLSLESVYPYIVTAIAEGGATASVSDTMEVFNAEEEAARIAAGEAEPEELRQYINNYLLSEPEGADADQLRTWRALKPLDMALIESFYRRVGGEI